MPPKKRRNGPKDAANQPRSCVQPTLLGGFGDTDRSTAAPFRTSLIPSPNACSTPGAVRPSHPALGATCSLICPSRRERVSQSFHDCLSCPACLGSVKASAMARRKLDFPEPLSPRITCQPAHFSLGTDHSCECRERMFLILITGMCIANLVPRLRRGGVSNAPPGDSLPAAAAVRLQRLPERSALGIDPPAG